MKTYPATKRISHSSPKDINVQDKTDKTGRLSGFEYSRFWEVIHALHSRAIEVFEDWGSQDCIFGEGLPTG